MADSPWRCVALVVGIIELIFAFLNLVTFAMLAHALNSVSGLMAIRNLPEAALEMLNMGFYFLAFMAFRCAVHLVACILLIMATSEQRIATNRKQSYNFTLVFLASQGFAVLMILIGAALNSGGTGPITGIVWEIVMFALVVPFLMDLNKPAAQTPVANPSAMYGQEQGQMMMMPPQEGQQQYPMSNNVPHLPQSYQQYQYPYPPASESQQLAMGQPQYGYPQMQPMQGYPPAQGAQPYRP